MSQLYTVKLIEALIIVFSLYLPLNCENQNNRCKILDQCFIYENICLGMYFISEYYSASQKPCVIFLFFLEFILHV